MPQFSVLWLVSEELRMEIRAPKIQDTLGKRYISTILSAVYSIRSPWWWQHHKEADRMPCPEKNTSHKKETLAHRMACSVQQAWQKNKAGILRSQLWHGLKPTVQGRLTAVMWDARLLSTVGTKLTF